MFVDLVQANLKQQKTKFNSLRLLTDDLAFFSSPLCPANTFQSGSFNYQTSASIESEDYTLHPRSKSTEVSNSNSRGEKYWKQIQMDSNQSEANRQQQVSDEIELTGQPHVL